MVYCTYCGQSFTRDEHLERHILTHTNVKPFKCFTCHMSFARRDLLQRHYLVHGRDQNQEVVPAANGVIPKSAGRTPIACSNCAKTKTKCDKKFPCSRCAGRNLRCQLRPTRRATKGVARVGMQSEVGPDLQGEQTGQQGSNTIQHQPPPLRPASPKNVVDPNVNTRPAPPVVDGPPPQMFEQPTSGPALGAPNGMSPPMQTPVSRFVQSTPPEFDVFPSANPDLSDNESSPRFMLDWNQMQMPMAYNGIVQPQILMNPHVGFDPNVGPFMPPPSSVDSMLSIMPGVANGIVPPLMTPIETPQLQQSYPESELTEVATEFHRRQSHMSRNSVHSVASVGEIGGEMPAIIAAQDSWNCFRCTPIVPSTSCPKTARLNLERLEQTLKDREGWSIWTPQWDEVDFAGADHLTVMHLHESTRDKLLAITQTFLHKALDIHRGESAGHQSPATGLQSPSSSGGHNYVLLPPARVSEYFLRSYANCFERYYPLTSKGILDPNELMHCYNDRAACLLVLMMMAQGAMNMPSLESRMLTGGLTEACRISLFDLIEKNIIMSGDPLVLHAALLFTVQAAWSGDKWQMDIAMGQRGMYFAMLRHSGVLESRQPASSTVDHRANTDQLWHEWIRGESKSRLVYSWIMVDQEMSLFHDTAPLFSVTECATPMPDADRLWHAKNAAEWSSLFEQVHAFSEGYSSVGSGARPLSLRDLFRHFLEDEMVPRGIELTPLQMRLLLHPIQALVCQYGQLLSCFSEPLSMHEKEAGKLTATSTRSRLGEVQTLLQRWFSLAERYLKTSPLCPMMQTNLVIYHLISLNAVTDFAEIEKLARREDFDGTYQQLVWLHRRCISNIEEAVYHCGQILRLVRGMPRGIRPPWWAGAIYRVALILWTDSLTNKEVAAPENGFFPVPGPSLAIDALPADHPLIVRYITTREGVPCVTKRDGSQIGIDHSITVLEHCVQVIDEGAATRFSDGIRNKLERLCRG